MKQITAMDDIRLAHLRGVIAKRLRSLDQEDALGADNRATVELDQQSVGRLSRMDALQGQAMAKAHHARHAAERHRLMRALARMDEGEFGYCEDCGDAIAPARLDSDPAAPLCISCARG